MVKYLFIYLILSSFILAQEKEISDQRDELIRLRNEIKELELQVKAKTSKEKKTFETLETQKKQAFIINSVINRLKKEEAQKQGEIDLSINEISLLEKEIARLKESYARSITGVYKYGNPSDIDIFLNSAGINEALLRRKYLQRFSQKRESDITHLKQNIRKISELKIRLEEERNEKNILAAEKLKEETNLKVRMNENTKLISLLRKNKTELKKEIDAKKKAEVKITSLINKLIADAEKKRKAEKERIAALEKNKKNIPKDEIVAGYDSEMSGFSSFRALKGRLTWPMQGKIKTKFGENKNPVLKTVTLNYGVDIEATRDLNVKCVADGIVSAIEWIPGYGSVIIITHPEDFRTVYSRLSEIFVTEGEKINAGKLIAKVGESIEGKILHFEIWSSRNNQNPEIWLARK